jgi:hypothetical protein
MPQLCDMGQDGFYVPSEEGVLKDFFALKNPTASARFEFANIGTKVQRATCRPPKSLKPSLYVSYFLSTVVNYTIKQ